MMQSEDAVKALFEKFKQLNILIIGDVMIDAYIWGKVERISPEAPVPVVLVNKRNNRLGGAANVALNIKALGANPILCSVVGDDEKAGTFIQMLEANEMFTGGILKSTNRTTTTKFRIIGNNVQMLRVDEEIDTNLNDHDFEDFIKLIGKIVTENQIDGIIFQDYDKGVISAQLIDFVVTMASSKNIPVSVDPKKRNFSSYQNLKLFKPNLKELREGLGFDFDKQDTENLRKAVRQIHEKQNIEIVLATLSEEGVFISKKNENEDYEEFHLPAHLRAIADVSGAGDTVVSMAALCLALGLSLREIAAFSNLAGGQVCESVGVVPVNREKLMKEMASLNL
jgi:rfaE bifunctional protein kinase chain/domain